MHKEVLFIYWNRWQSELFSPHQTLTPRQMKRLHRLFASYFDANRLFFRIIALSLHKN